MPMANFIFRNQRNVTLIFQRACILWTFVVHSKNIVPVVPIQLISISTARKRSLRRLCFYTCLSVNLFTGGVSASVHAGIHTPLPPWEQTPPPPGASRHLPRSRHSGNRHTPGADTPLHSPCLEIGATNRRHTPYWNAILLHRLLKTKFHCNSWIGMSLKSFALYTN